MLIIDMSNLVFGTILDYHASTKEQADISLIRHLIISKLVTEKKRLKEYADEIVLAFDSRHYWRKDVFPYYKASRKKGRDDSSFDWDSFFPAWDQFKAELREYFPVKCVEVHGAEADDIMAVLAMRYGTDPNTKVCILSSDKDLIQIQQNINPRIKQWSLFHKKFLTPKNTEYDLFEHVVRGDSGDGVPNILSAPEVLVTEGIRQKSLRTDKLTAWKRHGLREPELFCESEEMLQRFKTNRQIIDLTQIPSELVRSIIEAYESAEVPKGKMFTYLTANRLTRILAEGGF